MGNGKYYFALVSAAGGSGFNHGFHLSLFNTLLLILVKWIAEKKEQRWDDEEDVPELLNSKMLMPFLVACFALGAVMGSFLICFLASIGRKKVLQMSSCISLLALFFLGIAEFTQLYEVLIFGRVLMGFSVGISSGFSPMYLVEIAPFCVRGCAGCLYYVMVAVSMTFANILTTPDALGDDEQWPYIFVVGFVPPFIQLVSLFFCPESPKFLYFNRHDEDAAHEALEWLRDENVDEEMEELKEEYTVLKEFRFTASEICNNQLLRSPLIISVVAMIGQEMCGVDGIMYYTTVVISGLILHHRNPLTKAMHCSIGLGVCLFIISAISMLLLVERLGRRKLLLASFVGMVFSTVLLGVLYVITSHKQDLGPKIDTTAVVFLFFYVISYGLGAGPIPWFYIAELNNHSARPWAVCISVSIKWICHFTVAFVYLLLKLKMGAYFLTAFLAFDILVVIFLYLTMRETTQLTALEIMEIFYD